LTEFYLLESSEVIKKLNSSINGLTEKQAAELLKIHGLNKLAEEKELSVLQLFFNQFKNFLVLILIAAAIISVLMDFIQTEESHLIDAILIFAIVIANAFFGFLQDFKAEKSLKALKKLSALNAVVLREGKIKNISAELLVPGDIIVFEQGSIIPADCRIIEAIELEADESLLSGESIPVSKTNEKLNNKALIHEQKNMLFMNSVITRGKGKAIVTATGMNTEIGKIAGKLAETKEKVTVFQKEINELGKRIALIIFIAIIIIFFVELFFDSNANIFDLFLTSVSLAVAAIPEGLPAIVTLTLALGVKLMVKENALVRRMNVIQDLGSVDVICVDKTGTLTENKMQVTSVFFDDKRISINELKELNETAELLFKAGMLCNNSVYSFDENNKKNVFGEPTENALIFSAEKFNYNLEELNKEFPRLREIPFSSERKMMTTVHAAKNKAIVFSKGAVEILLEKSSFIFINGKIIPLTKEKKDKVLKENNLMASNALRVLGFAFKELKEYNNSITDKELESDLIFIGLQGMLDKPREGVLIALNECRNAGIKVIMITGDNKLTAEAIGHELGFKGKAIEGKEIESMTINELMKVLDETEIFARIIPMQKLQLLNALQNKGFVVAMTGDGVNDAPAIKNADVGISMGLKGTDVAKQASDMILLDDNFITIRNAIAEGRGIYDNIQKFVNYLLAANFAEVLVVFLASILAFGLPLTAIQLLWINLLTDGLPALALGVDQKEKNIMQRKPRAKTEGILNNRIIFSILSLGLLLSFVILILFYINLNDLIKAQTIVFTSFVLFELIKIYIIRLRYKLSIFSNKWLLLAVISSLMLQLLLLFTPLNSIFKLTMLSFNDWLQIGIAALIYIILGSLIMVFEAKIFKKTENE